MISRLAWHQLLHERLRLLAAVAGITFAVLLQLMQFGFRDSLYTSSTLIHARLQADLVMISAQYSYLVAPSTFARRRLYEALRVEGIDEVAALRLGRVSLKDPTNWEGRETLVLAFDPGERVFDLSEMRASAARLAATDVLLLDERARKELHPLVDRIRREGVVAAEASGHRVDLGGLFSLGVSFTGLAHAMSSDYTLRRMLHRPEGTIEVGLLRLKPGMDPETVRSALTALLTPDVKVVTREQFVGIEHAYWDRATPIGFIFALGTFVGLLVGAVIVYQILYTDVTDHLPEYATLKAMGYRDRALSLVVIQESLILSAMGFPVGLVLAQGLYVVARNATGLPIIMTGPRIAIVLALTVGMCVAAGLLAMRKLKSADPADAF